MPLFSKRKYDELDDVSTMTDAEREKAIASLEARRGEITEELEALMAKYARLTKNRKIRRRKFKLGKAPNDFKRLNSHS